MHNTILLEFIKPAGVTPYRVAKDSGISQPTMNQIVNGKRPISTETALRLATYFTTSCELWVNLQKNYDLRIAQRDLLPLIQEEVKPLQLLHAYTFEKCSKGSDSIAQKFA